MGSYLQGGFPFVLKLMPIGVYPHNLSKEHRDAIIKANTGNKYHLGFKHSDEVKKIISLKGIGRKRSEESKNKIRNIAKEKGYGLWMVGKKLSEETKKKIGDKSRGKPNINKG